MLQLRTVVHLIEKVFETSACFAEVVRDESKIGNKFTGTA